MADVVWTRRATVDVLVIRDHIGQFAPVAAQRTALRLRAAGDSLENFPERGRAIASGRRELVTVPPYLIRYRVKAGVVERLTVRHGARL